MKRILSLVALASLLAVAGAQAHLTVEATAPQGPFMRGETYTVPTTLYVNCAVIGAEYEEGQTLTVSIANAADYEWINATETDITISVLDCAPTTAPSLPGLYNVFDVDVEFTPTAMAPAFIGPVSLQPGAFGETNEGGAFDVEIAYDPAFSVTPAATTYSYEPGTGVLTVLLNLELSANANSVFSFDVTSELPDGVVAHIQDTLSVTAPYQDGVSSSLHQVELHFSSGAADHGSHEGMEHDAMEGAMDAMVASWESLDIAVDVTLAAADDPSQVSDVQTVSFSVNKLAGLDGEHNHDDHTHDDEPSFLENVGIPGPGIAVLIGAIGAIAITRRE